MPAPTHPANDESAYDALLDLLNNRHSCRAFRTEPVARVQIEKVIDAARKTASWCNSQPWSVIITSGEHTESFRTALYDHAGSAVAAHDFATPPSYDGVYLDRRRACGLQLYKNLGITREDRDGARLQGLENFRFFGAPHVAIITSAVSLATYGAIDCGAFVSTFLLAAESLGIACIPQAALAAFPEFVRAHFGLADDRRIVCGISFGYEDTFSPANGFRTDRASIDEVVTWHFGNASA